MEITEVRVFLSDEDRLKAYVTVTFDKCFVVRDLKIIQGNNGLFVAMPSKKGKDGSYKDIAHPIHSDFRQKLEDLILQKYYDEAGQPHSAVTQGMAAAGPASERSVSQEPIQRVIVNNEPQKTIPPVSPAYDAYRDAEAGIGPAYKK